MEELYESLYGMEVTVLSNAFLEKYLADAKPDYLKVFLYYLWKGIKERCTIEEASNELDLDINKVEMALKFWVKKKIIKKEVIIKDKSESVKEPDNCNNSQDKKKELIKKKKEEFAKVESNLLFVAEKLLGQTLTERQVNLISKCYNEYLFDTDAIEYLFEYCASKGQTNFKYMSAVTESWYEQGVKTAADAKKFTDGFEKGTAKPKKQVKANNKRAFDRTTDYNKVFMEGFNEGKFK